MAQTTLTNGTIGIDVIQHHSRFRFWLDKGRGKYTSIDVTDAEIESIVKLLNGFRGGMKAKPSRTYRTDIHEGA